jgi:hypothetical protein
LRHTHDALPKLPGGDKKRAQMLLELLLKRARASTRDLRRVETQAHTSRISPKWSARDKPIAASRRPRRRTRPVSISCRWSGKVSIWRGGSAAISARRMQTLIRFLNERRLWQRAEELTGYDPSSPGQIRFST